MTTDFEARHASVGVGWDHHAQDAFIQLNWVTTEAKLWQAPALTAQACQKTLIWTPASRACHNVYTEIVTQSWEGGCYSDHNHRTDSRPQNQWTAALSAWFHHVQQWTKEKHRQNVNQLFFTFQQLAEEQFTKKWCFWEIRCLRCPICWSIP